MCFSHTYLNNFCFSIRILNVHTHMVIKIGTTFNWRELQVFFYFNLRFLIVKTVFFRHNKFRLLSICLLLFRQSFFYLFLFLFLFIFFIYFFIYISLFFSVFFFKNTKKNFCPLKYRADPMFFLSTSAYFVNGNT